MSCIREPVGTVSTELHLVKCAGPLDPGQCLLTYNHTCYCYTATWVHLMNTMPAALQGYEVILASCCK